MASSPPLGQNQKHILSGCHEHKYLNQYLSPFIRHSSTSNHTLRTREPCLSSSHGESTGWHSAAQPQGSQDTTTVVGRLRFPTHRSVRPQQAGESAALVAPRTGIHAAATAESQGHPQAADATRCDHGCGRSAQTHRQEARLDALGTSRFGGLLLALGLQQADPDAPHGESGGGTQSIPEESPEQLQNIRIRRRSNTQVREE